MKRKLSVIKQKILNSKWGVSPVSTYASHENNSNTIFAIYDKSLIRLADFSVTQITKNIVRYEIILDYKNKISRTAITNVKWHRPGVRDMMEIHSAILQRMNLR